MRIVCVPSQAHVRVQYDAAVAKIKDAEALMMKVRAAEIKKEMQLHQEVGVGSFSDLKEYLYLT